ncbi:MAG: proline--tRNA ligase [Acidimicrobiales bacterium]
MPEKNRPGAITSQSEDFPRWYQDVIAKAELADNGPVRGTMVIRPYGYAIWERIQSEVDMRIKAAGARNAYFPLLIPESYLHREAEHVEGFSPELAVVTHGGGKVLEEPAVVRPTSETIINAYFAKWIQSYRDLPLLINQWANVVRWELRPRLFLRTTEFLWQEGHTAHATAGEARQYALRILREVYEDFMVNVMAVPVIAGRKTVRERFPGADQSWTCEGMMRDQKALQMGTSHELGQRFSKMFGTTFQSEDGETHVWQTSWGVSTRLLGALIMSHGDDSGLCLPPLLAPVQVAVIPVAASDEVQVAADAILRDLEAAGHRVEMDTRTDSSYGRRVTAWDLKGVPVRIDVGPRELATGSVTMTLRDSGEKKSIPVPSVAGEVQEALATIQKRMLYKARSFREQHTHESTSLNNATERVAQGGFATLPWRSVGIDGEASLAREGLSVRCLVAEDGSLPVDINDNDTIAVIGKAY